MSSLWFWTPLLWKALCFIVLFNYEILSSVIRCDSVTDSTWQRRDCPDWITGRTEPAEPHACEPWHSTSPLQRAPRSHPGGDWSSLHLLTPLLPGSADFPAATTPGMVPSVTLPLAEEHKPVVAPWLWHILEVLWACAEPKAALTLCKHETSPLWFGLLVALDMHTPITGLW